jgi:hypothetical protein
MLLRRTNSVRERRLLSSGQSVVARRVLFGTDHDCKSFVMSGGDSNKTGSGLQFGLHQDA